MKPLGISKVLIELEESVPIDHWTGHKPAAAGQVINQLQPFSTIAAFTSRPSCSKHKSARLASLWVGHVPAYPAGRIPSSSWASGSRRHCRPCQV